MTSTEVTETKAATEEQVDDNVDLTTVQEGLKETKEIQTSRVIEEQSKETTISQEENKTPQIPTSISTKTQDDNMTHEAPSLKAKIQDETRSMETSSTTKDPEILKINLIPSTEQDNFKLITYGSLAVLFCMMAYLIYSRKRGSESSNRRFGRRGKQYRKLEDNDE